MSCEEKIKAVEDIIRIKHFGTISDVIYDYVNENKYELIMFNDIYGLLDEAEIGIGDCVIEKVLSSKQNERIHLDIICKVFISGYVYDIGYDSDMVEYYRVEASADLNLNDFPIRYVGNYSI